MKHRAAHYKPLLYLLRNQRSTKISTSFFAVNIGMRGFYAFPWKGIDSGFKWILTCWTVHFTTVPCILVFYFSKIYLRFYLCSCNNWCWFLGTSYWSLVYHILHTVSVPRLCFPFVSVTLIIIYHGIIAVSNVHHGNLYFMPYESYATIHNFYTKDFLRTPT